MYIGVCVVYTRYICVFTSCMCVCVCQVYPEKKDEIEKSFTSLLLNLSKSLNADMRGFIQYYTKNFAIPPQVPIYGMEFEQSRGAEDRLLGFQNSAMASAHLNVQLLERIRQLRAISVRHEQLLARVRKAKESVKQLEEVKGLLARLRAEVDSITVSDNLSECPPHKPDL